MSIDILAAEQLPLCYTLPETIAQTSILSVFLRKSEGLGHDVGAMDGLIDAITDRSSAGIAAALGRLIRSGVLTPGDRLPTVREVARLLHVSPATVSEAWRALAAVGVIEARGRLGTFVIDRSPTTTPRYSRMSSAAGRFDLDLSTGTPDENLLPDVGPALAATGAKRMASTYHDIPIVPDLDVQLRSSWPFAAGALTVVDGALDALDRVGREVLRLGDRVLVENPAFPPTLDLLDKLGVEPVPIALDDCGMRPDHLATALADARPRAVMLQPRAQNPTGVTMTAGRAEDLAAALGAFPEVVVIEDDHAGSISTGADVSIGAFLPEQTVHIRSYSKSYGPDLRIAALGGAASVVEPVADRRLLGPGWTSRLLQTVLVYLLTSAEAGDQVDQARTTYAERQQKFAAALSEAGVPLSAGDGINVWVPVADEQAALVTLAASGVKVAPGSPFVVAPLPEGDHIRITLTLPDRRIPDIARQVADAARPGGRYGARR